MGISFLGNTYDYKTWFFTIDGKTFVASNSSTVSPLKMMFTGGRFYGTFRPDQIIPGVVLVKNHSFDIITGTSESKGVDYIGIVEWTWAGQKYRSAWKLFEGNVIREGIPEENDPGIYSYDLFIIPPYVPYDGPTGGAVGTGGVTNTQSPPPAAIPVIVPSLPIDQNTNIMGGGQNQVRIPPPVIPPTAVTSAPVTGTDWVKVGIQLGVAYFILS